jgi:hypothetical protein
MPEGITEESSLKTNTGFALKLIGGVVFCVYSGAMIFARINTLEMEILRLQHEVELNSEFRIKWPRGELGALPDDAEQNMRLAFLEKQAGKHDQLLEKLRYKESE